MNYHKNIQKKKILCNFCKKGYEFRMRRWKENNKENENSYIEILKILNVKFTWFK